MKLKVAVIGAGIGGLATAIRLAIRGHEVSVYDQSFEVGGKLGQIQWNDYRWDTGPSLLTLPELLEELFFLADEEMKVHLRCNQLEVICKYFYEDGKVLKAYGDPDEFISEMTKKTGESASRIRKFLKRSEKMYDLTKDVFIFNSFHSFFGIFTKNFLRAALQIRKLSAFSSMHTSNRRWFRSKHLIQLFDRYATYNGSNPYKAPGTLNVISHLEHNLGAYYPEGGMRHIAEELYKLALRLGVSFSLNSKVDRILMEGKLVKGIRVNDAEIKADIVISDIDIFQLYSKLLPDLPFPEQYFKSERSSSAMVFHWAVDREVPELDLHNILFSDDYREEFRCLFKHKTISSDPTVYIFISSREDANDAPPVGENWFVMVNAPENTGQNWGALRKEVKSNIIKKINRILNIEIEKHILYEKVRDPRDIEAETFSYKGSIYGNSSNNKMAAFSRHPNFRSDIYGLYFVGGSVHPGGGIPLCLSSAKIVSDHITNHYY